MIKKILIAVASLVLIIIISGMSIVYIYKDDIKKEINNIISESVNAKIHLVPENISTTIFKDFPNITVGVEQFKIINNAPFDNTVLMNVERFEIEIDVLSLFDDQIQVLGISLYNPKINIKVLSNGTVNYDITFPDTTSTTSIDSFSNESSSKFDININHWKIEGGEITYDDATFPLKCIVRNLSHEGSGNFNEIKFDISSQTTVESFDFSYDGVQYLSKKQIDAAVVMTISENYSHYSFGNNNIKLNDLPLSFKGWVSLNDDESIGMDMKYETPNISFKSLLSLVPSLYKEDLNGLKSSGEISISGILNGKYSDLTLPSFEVFLNITDGMFQYADLPLPATDINITTLIKNTDGIINNTIIDVSKFHLKAGKNPFDATLLLTNLDDIKWNFSIDGKIDLETITKIVPLDSMTLKGLIDVGFKTTGQLSYIDANRYEEIPTSGNVIVSGLEYTYEALPYGIKIHKADLKFDPKNITLSTFNSEIGSSDMNIEGEIRNYLKYFLTDNQILKGVVNFNSNSLDIDEILEEETESPTSNNNETETANEEPRSDNEKDSTTFEVIRIPQNLDFEFNTNIKKVKMLDMDFKNVSGKVILKEGTANLSGLNFSSLGGDFIVKGFYDTKEKENPLYNFSLDIKDLSLSKSFETFQIVQKYVPIAKTLTGDVSTKFEIGGLLSKNMMPIFKSINGNGLLNIAKASVDNPEFLKKLSSVTKLDKTEDKITLKDVLMSVNITDGNLEVKPFDINIGNHKTNISGKTSFDGNLDYILNMTVPTGTVGKQINNYLNRYIDIGPTPKNIQIPIKISGMYDDPKFTLLGVSNKKVVKSQVKTVLKKEAKNQLEKKLNVDLDKEKEIQREKILAEAQSQYEKIIEQGKINAEKIRKEGYLQADNLISKAGSNFFKKKTAEIAAKKLKQETDIKASRIEDEFKKRADDILKKAKTTAQNIK